MQNCIKSLLVASILYVAMVGSSYGQVNCSGAIANANTLYEQGKLQDAISALNPCLQNKLDKTNLWQGYKILSLAYLGLNDPVNARKAAENMLEINPLYKPSLIDDPSDFVNLINSITIIPGFSLGMSAAGGINNTIVRPQTTYTVSDYTKNYRSKPGYQFGINLGYSISKNISLGLSVFSNYKNYEIGYTTNNFNVTLNEKLSYIELPLMLTYSIGKGKIRPFISAGAFEGFLVSAKSDFSSVYIPTGEVLSDENVNAADRRIKNNFGIVGRIGFTYKSGPRGHFIFDLSYSHGLNNIVNGANRYNNENILYKYYYLDDDIKISNAMATVGYVFYMNYKVVRSK